MQLARINIIEPNGVKRSVALGNRPLTIGRDPECDIAIGYERASRHHAQIAFDGQRYFIIDLNSTNGTYLGNTRLTPNVPTEWFPNVSARIGDIYFHLELQQSGGSSQGYGNRPPYSAPAPGYASTENESSNNITQILVVLFLAILSVCCCAGLGTLVCFSAFY